MLVPVMDFCSGSPMQFLSGVDSSININSHQPKIIVRAVEISDHHLSDPILLLARERAKILHHLFEQRAHREKHNTSRRTTSVSVPENDATKSEGHDQDRNDGDRAEHAISCGFLAAPIFGVA